MEIIIQLGWLLFQKYLWSCLLIWNYSWWLRWTFIRFKLYRTVLSPKQRIPTTYLFLFFTLLFNKIEIFESLLVQMASYAWGVEILRWLCKIIWRYWSKCLLCFKGLKWKLLINLSIMRLIRFIWSNEWFDWCSWKRWRLNSRIL